MDRTRRSLASLIGLVGAPFGLAGLAPAFAADTVDDFPSRPIRLIVPFGPGGSNDVLARVLSAQLKSRSGQTALVENKPGASGSIGGAYVASSPADGYTLLIVQNGLTMAPWIQKNMGYDPMKLEPIIIAVTLPMVITVNTALPVKTVADLIAYAKAHPGQLSYATPGIGTPHHLAAELFKKLTGTDMFMVPYKGTAEIATEMIGGRVNVLFSAVDTMRPHIQSGKIRLIAVAGSQRLPDFPDVPIVNDTVPGFDVPFWLGVAAPAGTPKRVTEQLAREMTAILTVPETVKRLADTGMTVDVSPPGKMRDIMVADYERWGSVVKSAGIVGE